MFHGAYIPVGYKGWDCRTLVTNGQGPGKNGSAGRRMTRQLSHRASTLLQHVPASWVHFSGYYPRLRCISALPQTRRPGQ